MTLRLHFMLAALLWLPLTNCYDLLTDWSGESFFDNWDWYGSWDNLTLGDVWWLDEANATGSGLAYVNGAGNAIIKVDNESYVPFNQKRNSVRITSQQEYDFGSVWVIDALHIPYGCSVWPAFWSFGADWPAGGEIDIIEAVNVMPNNQMALHTTEGCFHDTWWGSETGTAGESDCSPGAGCTVMENTPNSFESGFAAAGGGVWVTQFDVSGIFIWFFSRPDVPEAIGAASATVPLNISDLGTPSASYPNGSSCDVSNFFGPQKLVIDITLCGNWAGIGPVYNATCGASGPTGLCYNDCVVGPGSPTYDEAYFEISYVRAFTTGAASSSTAIFAPTTTMNPAPSETDNVTFTGVTSTGVVGSGSGSSTSSAHLAPPTTLDPTGLISRAPALLPNGGLWAMTFGLAAALHYLL